MSTKTKLLIAAAFSVVIIVGLIGRGPFIQWRIRRLAATAQALLAKGDDRGASLTARVVMQKDPGNIAACTVLAQIAGAQRSPAAIVWREKLAELQPGNTQALLDLAAIATNLGEAFVTESALNRIPESDRQTGSYHQAAAAWSMSIGHYAIAEQHFQKAVELDPHNVPLRLNLAALRLALASSPTVTAEARAELEALQKIPESRLEATRDLIADARRRGDTAASGKMANELQTTPGATLADHLLYLEELQHAKDPTFDAQLTSLRHGATNPGVIYTIMEWMNAHGLAAESVQWHQTLPENLRTQIPEPLAVAEACVQLGDWKALRALMTGAHWGDLEFLRLAFEARLVEEASHHARSGEFAGRWEHAMNSTAGNTNAISMLARLVQSWGWKSEAAQLWWLLANRHLGQRPALAALFEMSFAEKNTRELYRISRRIYEVEPTSPIAKNNVAMFALLLGEDLPEAHRFAEENFKLGPHQPEFLSTYAFSLYRLNRAQEAATLMAGLPAEALTDPSLAACYGVLLASLGENEKARPFLELARREKSRLLPEEAALVAQALAPSQP